jgi:hypothetical protein
MEKVAILDFFKLGALLEDREKLIHFFQNYGVIPEDTRKNCDLTK